MSPSVPPTPTVPTPPPAARRPRLPWAVLAGVAVGCGLGLFGLMTLAGPKPAAADAAAPGQDPPAGKAETPKPEEKKPEPRPEERKRVAAPEFEPGLTWLNT